MKAALKAFSVVLLCALSTPAWAQDKGDTKPAAKPDAKKDDGKKAAPKKDTAKKDDGKKPEAKKTGKKEKQKTAADWAFQLEKGKKQRERREAAKKLRLLGKKASEFIDVMLKACLAKENDTETRVHLTYALGAQKAAADRTLPVLVKLLDDKNDEVNSAAAEALGSLGKGALVAVPSLIKKLSSKDEDVRIASVETLGKIGPEAKAAVPELIKRMHGDGSLYVKRKSARALGHIQDDPAKVLPELAKALKDKDPVLRFAASEAIGKYGDKAEPVIDNLISMLKDESSAYFGSMALTKIGKVALPACEKELTGGTLVSRQYALEAIAGMPFELSFPALRKALKSNKDSVRAGACQAIGSFGTRSKEALKELEALLKDPSKTVQRAAQGAIQRIKG